MANAPDRTAPEAGSAAAEPSDELAGAPHDLGLLRSVTRDPEHAPERLTSYAVERLAAPAHAWAEQVRAAESDVDVSARSEKLRTGVAHFARIRGAIAGTPFLIAIVPAYMSVLWDEAQMVMRVAALHGRDPREPGMAAELLVLRGVHPTVEEAQAAIDEIEPLPERKGVRARLSIKLWWRLVAQVLVLAGFIQRDKPGAPKANRWRVVFQTVVGIVIWALTWIVPVTFMIVMSWTCESDARKLGSRTIEYYGEPPEKRNANALARLREVRERGETRRTIIRVVGLALSLGIPIAVLAFAVIWSPKGHEWLRLVGIAAGVLLLVGLTLYGRWSARESA